MKSKKLKKMAKLLFEEVNKHQNNSVEINSKYSESLETETEYMTYDYNEYDEVVSERAKTMITNLFQYRDKLSFNISGHEIYIGCDDLTSIKKKHTNNKLLVNNYNYIQVYVYKDKGFTLNYNDVGISKYKDNKMYDELIPEIKRISNDINRDNFENTYQQIMKVSGVIREANLDEVFNP